MRFPVLFKTALIVGLFPLLSSSLILFILWFCRTVFAVDDKTEGTQFLIEILIAPMYLISIALIIISIFTNIKIRKYARPILGLVFILLSFPILIVVLKKNGQISERAYIKLQNNSGQDIINLKIIEPDQSNEFGKLRANDSKVIFYQPDYFSAKGIQYAGISQNFFVFNLRDTVVKKQIPIIQPGEIHKLTINANFNLDDIFINKIIFKNATTSQ